MSSRRRRRGAFLALATAQPASGTESIEAHPMLPGSASNTGLAPSVRLESAPQSPPVGRRIPVVRWSLPQRLRLWWQVYTGQDATPLESDAPAWAVSLFVHVAVLVMLAACTFLLPAAPEQ